MWVRADLGVTYGGMGPVTATGTAPPTITLSGTPAASVTQIRIECTTGGALGVWILRWSSDGGTTFTSNVTSAANVVLGATGITAAIAVGNATNDNVWTSSPVATTLADQSTNAKNLTQAVLAAMPAWVPNVVNGQPVLRFAGAQEIDSISAASLAPATLTMFVVFQATGGAGEQGVAGSWKSVASRGAQINRLVAGPNGQCYAYISTTGITPNGAGSVLAASTWGIMTQTFDGTINPNGVKLYKNNTLGTQINSTSATYTSPQPFLLGQRSGTVFLTGDIAEAGMYSRVLTVTEMTQLHRYLGSRYGIVVP